MPTSRITPLDESAVFCQDNLAWPLLIKAIFKLYSSSSIDNAWLSGSCDLIKKQTVIKETNAYVTLGSTGVNLDNTSMLITEGNHITELETSVTPQKAGSKIEVNILLITGMNTVGTQIIGLFENSATSAVASFVKTIGNTVIPQQFLYE